MLWDRDYDLSVSPYAAIFDGIKNLAGEHQNVVGDIDVLHFCYTFSYQFQILFGTPYTPKAVLPVTMPERLTRCKRPESIEIFDFIRHTLNQLASTYFRSFGTSLGIPLLPYRLQIARTIAQEHVTDWLTCLAELAWSSMS